ncbi:MAG: hypothetical protein PUK59_08285 [Actinomycetaceae bacterium]|nr:hypothetical protein [Actinomycetaceae bacterium]MDY5854749.1 hypothetical protein [Arcanobacterium sp.]
MTRGRREARWGVAALAVAALAVTAGCSAIGGSSKAALTDGLVRSADFAKLNSLGFSDEKVRLAAQCTADAIDGELSREALRAITDGAFNSQLSKSDYDQLAQAISECALDMVDANSANSGA